MKSVLIIGGGLAGLTASILLARNGYRVKLIERKKYPFHRVCGEYISNEVKPFMKAHDLYPHEAEPADIETFELTATNGHRAQMPLDLGGFGISRYFLDDHLAKIAMATGVELIHEKVDNVHWNGGLFEITTDKKAYEAPLLVGSFGKRSNLDKTLKRSFIEKRSPYVGVKYHIKYDDHAPTSVALHNFEGGYCGINRVENDVYNLCYLSARSNLRKWGNIDEMEMQVLRKNPFLNTIFSSAEFLFDKPEVINEISFETKLPVENHVLMCGDAAGMITPLCGNGMAIAMHSAKIVSEVIFRHLTDHKINRPELEREYTYRWNDMFRQRLWVGRNIQKMFGAPWLSNMAVNICNNVRPVANYLMSKTHGRPIAH